MRWASVVIVAVAAHVVIVIVPLAGWTACEAHLGIRAIEAPRALVVRRLRPACGRPASSVRRRPRAQSVRSLIRRGSDQQEIGREPMRPGPCPPLRGTPGGVRAAAPVKTQQDVIVAVEDRYAPRRCQMLGCSILQDAAIA